MKSLRQYGWMVLPLVYFNVAWNLLLFGLNPAWGSMVLAWAWLTAGFALVIRRRVVAKRQRATARNHAFLMRPQSRLPDPFRRPVFVLKAGEQVIPIPQVGGSNCSHRSRDEVKLSDGTTVAYICRRCNHDWADEQWVKATT